MELAPKNVVDRTNVILATYNLIDGGKTLNSIDWEVSGSFKYADINEIHEFSNVSFSWRYGKLRGKFNNFILGFDEARDEFYGRGTSVTAGIFEAASPPIHAALVYTFGFSLLGGVSGLVGSTYILHRGVEIDSVQTPLENPLLWQSTAVPDSDYQLIR